MLPYNALANCPSFVVDNHVLKFKKNGIYENCREIKIKSENLVCMYSIYFFNFMYLGSLFMHYVYMYACRISMTCIVTS